MRYIPRNCIKPQAELAKPVLGPAGEILLHPGVKMTEKYIERLEKLGIGGAYVNDPISEDLEIVGAVSDELRAHAVKSISSLYSGVSQNSGRNPRAEYREILQTAEQIVDEIISKGETMLNIFDLKVYDSYTFFHCVNVTVLSVVIGIGMGLERDTLVDLAYAALFHDIGKVFISPSIINKPGRLTDEEFAIVKKHPADGYEYIKKRYLTPELTARGVLDHHERIDGTGYPEWKRGTEITEFGRIIAIADVYDALVSDRPYRAGLFAVEAIEYIQGGSGKLFDFNMVQAFSRKVALFPVGTCVSLSNGDIGLVMENFEGFTQRPLLKVFRRGEELIKPFLLNLCKEAFDTTIVATVEA